MNSVAIPASAPSQAPSAEADLARAAARGDSDAFAELFRRHSQLAWRLAQAVAPGADSASAAFRDGFGRAARSRRAAAAGGAFRPAVLAAVYRSALEQAQNPDVAPSPVRRAPDAGSALVGAAFRSLPERWRAALWLSDVESMDVSRISPILGVSAAVATQLVTRGRRGLAGRFAQAHHPVPEHLGEVLRAVALDMPANLEKVTQARWAAAGSERSPRFAPVTAWMENHAVRPASVAVGTLVGLGLIGLGVIPQGSPVRAQLGATGAGSLGGAVPVQSCLGLPCSGTGGRSVGGGAGTTMTALSGANPLGATLTSASGPSAGNQAGGITGGSGGGAGTGGPTSLAPGGNSTGGGSGTGPGAGTGGTGTGSGGTGSGGTGSGGTGSGGTGSGGTGSGGGGGGSTLPSPTTTIPTVNLAPVATVSSSGSSLNVTLLPTSPLSTTVTVPLPAPTTTTTTVAPATTTTTTPLSGVTNTVTGTLSGVTNTVTSTVTTLLPGL